MHFLAILGLGFAVAGADRAPVNQRAETDVPLYAPEITILEPNKAYVVKLDCPGCPFAIRETNTQVTWQEPPQDNALRLSFTVLASYNSPNPSLQLNGRRILPLDSMPLNINAFQIPANVTTDDMTLLGLGPTMWGVELPLQYKHTVLRTEEFGQLWVQFDVTGLSLSKTDDPRFPYLNREPIRLDGQDQKLVQLLLRQQNETSQMFIADIQVVSRKDRAQPYRMKCGRLAMVQTSFDPTEWDQYGKIGSFSRLQNLAIGKVSDFWSDNVLVFAIALLLVVGVVTVRRQRRENQQEWEFHDDDAEIALMGLEEYEDAPPAYADIPVIKIEEYD